MENQTHRKKFWTAEFVLQSILWLILIILGIVFFKERVCQTDAAEAIVTLVNTKSFLFVHGRFASFFTEFFSVVAIKMGASLQVCMAILSATVPTVFLLISLFIKKVTGEDKYGWLFLSTQILWIHKSYFYPIGDFFNIFLSLYFMVFYLQCYGKQSMVFIYIWSLVFFILIVFSHPVATINAIIVFGYLIISRDRKEAKGLISLCLLFILVFLIHKWGFHYNPYEQGRLGAFTENLKHWETLEKSTMKWHTDGLYRYNWLYKTIFVVVVFFLTIQMKWILIAYGFIVGYAGHILCSIYFYTISTDYYIEFYYQCVGLVFALGIYEVSRTWDKRIRAGAHMIVFVFFVYRILNYASYYENRIKYHRHIIKYCSTKYGAHKFFIQRGKIQEENLGPLWAMASESLLVNELYDEGGYCFCDEAFNRPNGIHAFYWKDRGVENAYQVIDTSYFTLYTGQYLDVDSMPRMYFKK